MPFHVSILFQTSFRNGSCISEYYIEGQTGIYVFKGFATYILILIFLFPALAFIFLYGRYA